jgi:hypothetical protein
LTRVLRSLPLLALAALLAGAAPALAVSGFVRVTSPTVPGSNVNELDGVASVSGSEAWTVGFSRVGSGPFRALVEHFQRRRLVYHGGRRAPPSR